MVAQVPVCGREDGDDGRSAGRRFDVQSRGRNLYPTHMSVGNLHLL